MPALIKGVRREIWCPGTESNRHAPFGARDFKSRASASFATRAFCGKPLEGSTLIERLTVCNLRCVGLAVTGRGVHEGQFVSQCNTIA